MSVPIEYCTEVPTEIAHSGRPQASPLVRLVSDHLQRLRTVYDEHFAREYGPWRSVVAQVADKIFACGVLDHGFARVLCGAMRIVAFIKQTSVIDQILTHLLTRAAREAHAGPQGPPSTRGR